MYKLSLIFFFVIFGLVEGAGSINAQTVLEDQGDQGIFRSLKGQVVDPTETPLVSATISMTNEATENEFLVESDKNGYFEVKALPKGRYRVYISVSGFNDTTFTIAIDKKLPSGSKDYLIATLSVACGGGGANIKRVERLNEE